MRPIKFRAWLRKQRTFASFISGSGINLSGDQVEAYAPEAVWSQFVGLKDKNGKEIYEGDIVKANDFSALDKRWLVKWIDARAGFYMCGRFAIDMPNCEVIGNIYENPELLPKSVE